MIYVITAVHNRADITRRFVEQLNNQTINDIIFVMVDDGCTDNTVSLVRKLRDNTVIISGNGDLWWGGALHEAYKWICHHAENEGYVMFANDDSSFANDYIEKAVHILQMKPGILLAGCGISKQSNKLMDGAVTYYPEDTQFKISVGEGNCASTRSLFCRVADVKKIGGFHPRLLPHYWSDYEWTIRACAQNGYKVMCQKDLVYYLNEETTGANDCLTINRRQALSKRSVANPWYKLVFIIMVTPRKFIVKALINQIKRYFNVRNTIREILNR